MRTQVENATALGDPVDQMLRVAASADHIKAKQRGERVHRLTARIVSELHAQGMLRCAQADAHVEIQRVVVDDLYGDVAVDLRGAL